MRAIVDIPDKYLNTLSDECKKYNISRAEIIRRAIELYIDKIIIKDKDLAFGIWQFKKINSLNYQENIRNEW